MLNMKRNTTTNILQQTLQKGSSLRVSSLCSIQIYLVAALLSPSTPPEILFQSDTYNSNNKSGSK